MGTRILLACAQVCQNLNNGQNIRKVAETTAGDYCRMFLADTFILYVF